MNINIEIKETKNIGNYNTLYAYVSINKKFFKKIAMEYSTNIKGLIHTVAHSLSEDPDFKLIHDVSDSNSDVDGIISKSGETKQTPAQGVEEFANTLSKIIPPYKQTSVCANCKSKPEDESYSPCCSLDCWHSLRGNGSHILRRLFE